MDKKPIEFPRDFLWGTAVCSHQAEGYNVHSDWWEWEHKGKILDGSVSGPAADMLNRYPEDFEFMESQGYNAFRMSIEWARIEPRQGKYSSEALDHYENVFKELKKRDIKLCLTLYHWVLPKWVADKGGWLSNESVEWFRSFVKLVVDRFHKYVDLWVTLNEPTAPMIAGYIVGEFPPEKKNFLLATRVFKNLLKAHVAAYKLITAKSKELDAGQPKIGVAHALIYFEPLDENNVIDRKVHEYLKFMHNIAFVQAMKTGQIPFPFGFNETIPGLAGSYTFIGVNYYLRMRLDMFPKKLPSQMQDLLYSPEGMETTGMGRGYEVYPPGMYYILNEMSEPGIPIYITENGCADDTDRQRPGYTLRHLNQVHRAMADGVDVRGYFHWSYIDNFEWKFGFEKKLGLVELEPGTLNRKPRPSAYMYGEIACSNRITSELVRQYAPQVESELWG